MLTLDVDFVADAGDVNENLRRIFFKQFAVQSSDHFLGSFFSTKAVQALRAPRP